MDGVPRLEVLAEQASSSKQCFPMASDAAPASRLMLSVLVLTSGLTTNCEMKPTTLFVVVF